MSDASKAVFLSYASQDAEAAKRIAEALRAAGVEVWFDQSELRGGDSWDGKIRKQIKECALFVPVISANTNARAEGYFRLEWKLAVDRSHLMADDAHFLFPVVIDDTADATARVPDKFRDVQWMRLNVKDTPETLAARVGKLLGGEMEAGRPRPAGRGEGAASPRVSHWMRNLGMIMGLTIGLVYALRPLWSPVHRPEPKPAITAPPVIPSAPEKPLSEARQLLAQARVLSLDKYDSSADDYAAAEGLLKQALALDQNDGEIWAFSSLFNTSMRTRGFDHAPARREMARRDAERALKLAPDSLEALRALGRAQRDFEPEAAEQTFNRVLARYPDDAVALGNLAWIYDQTGRVDEAAAIYERLVTLDPAHAALNRYTEFLLFFHYNRLAEADRCIRQSVAIQPSTNSQGGLAMLLLSWKGDAEEAARVLATGPTASRNEPRTIWITAFVDLCRRAPGHALKTLDRLADDYIQDNWFTGPKAYFAGRAHQLAGRPEAARIAWESALALTNARLKDAPGSLGQHLMRGELLAFLGQTDEALREARAVAELAGGSDRDERYWFISPALIYAALGRADEALPLLEKLCLAPPGQIVGWPLTPALLRVDPIWDKIRDDPRFQKLAMGDLVGTGAPPARDWPKDPELKRAVALLDRLDAIPEDFKLAEDMVGRALEKAPSDPETATAMARVQSMWLLRGWEQTEDRSRKAKSATERALQLAPDEPEALAALGIYLLVRGGEENRAREKLERAIQLCPGEPRFYRMRDNLLFFQRGVPRAEAFASSERTAALFPDNALVHYELGRQYRNAGRLAEFERENDAALALAPVANAFVWKARAQFALHGDFAGMKATLDRVPARVRATERTVLGYFTYAAFSDHPAEGLEALQMMPDTWLVDFDYVGPKGLPVAILLELQGKPALARLQYEAALAEVQRRKASEPTNVELLKDEAWILHGLGRKAEALAAARVSLEAVERPYTLTPLTSWWFQAIPLHLLLGDRATALQLLGEIAAKPGMRDAIRLRLQFDSRMAPFRADPEIMALLAEPADASRAISNPPPDQKSVAVLAFTNLSDDKANEYFSDGISEELLNVLAKVPGLKVTARTSSFHFKGKDTSVPEIAQQLGVAYVVEGSVRKAGNKVRITAQLIKAVDGFHVWSDSFDRELKDVFAVQDEIAGLIAKNLRLKLDGAPRPVVQVDPEAYQFYLQGRQALWLRTEAAFDEAEKLFLRAKAIAPGWAPVYAALAETLRLRNFTSGRNRLEQGGTWPPELVNAKALADYALVLDPNLPEAYVALGGILMIRGELPGAEKLIRQALELNPNEADAYLVLGRIYAALGRMDESIEAFRHGAELNPLAARILDNLAAELNFAGRYDEGWKTISRAAALQPDSSQIQCYQARLLASLGRREEALQMAEKLMHHSDPAELDMRRIEAAAVFARFGRKAEAEAALAQVSPAGETHAVGLAYVGRPDEALRELDRIEFGWVEDVLWGPSFDPVRDDPRFAAFLRGAGLVEAQARATAWRVAHGIGPKAKP